MRYAMRVGSRNMVPVKGLINLLIGKLKGFKRLKGYKVRFLGRKSNFANFSCALHVCVPICAPIWFAKPLYSVKSRRNILFLSREFSLNNFKIVLRN